MRDTSLKVLHGESGKVIGIRVFSCEDEDELRAGANELVRVWLRNARSPDGDKLGRPAWQQGRDRQDPAG